MIVKENGLRYAKLIHVSVDNGKTEYSNKFYIMEELPDGRIKCEYGSVGKTSAVDYKDASKWRSVYKQKTGSRGYSDVTDYIAEPVVKTDTNSNTSIDGIKEVTVKKLIADLMGYANKTIQQNYKVTQEAVSEQQVNDAQNVVNQISSLFKLKADIKPMNDLLLRLYTIIPRRMKNVKNHLFADVNTKDSLEEARRLLDNEQSMLDSMAGQVQLIQQQQAAAKDDDKTNDGDVLAQMGLSVSVETDSEMLSLINKLLGSNSNQAKKVFKVVNNKTQVKFDNNLSKAKVKKKRFYWHGSRNENWFNILQTGLLIRPSGAVHTGSMFGDGIYFADKAQKSIGYTSLSGSYWARGSANKAYLALFDVHLGNQKEITTWSSDCKNLSEKVLKKTGHDSVFAKGGYDLRNNEYVVYNSTQCTVSHLVEISN